MEEVREVANAVGRCQTLKEYLGAKLVLVGEGIEIINQVLRSAWCSPSSVPHKEEKEEDEEDYKEIKKR